MLITVGSGNRFLEDQSPDIPRNLFFETVFETKAVGDDKVGCFKVFPDIQDHPDHHVGVDKRLLEDLSPDSPRD